MKKIFFSVLMVLFMSLSANSQSILPAEWKFLPDDKPEYADSSFNEYWWSDISPLTPWENQGHLDYDGYAWYRVKVVVPKSMKKSAEKYDGLILRLGKIDDADITYFNGHIVGTTGAFPPSYASAYDTPRAYIIPPDMVQWGKKNTIAIRVYDAGGFGGLNGGPVELTNRGNPDLIQLTTAFPEPDLIIKGSPDVVIPVSLKSDFKKKYRGTLSLKIITDAGEDVTTESQEITINKNSTEVFTFKLKGLVPGFYKATAAVAGNMGNRELKFNFGYEPEKIISPADPQPDFAEFWQRAKAELKTVDPEYKMIRIDSLCTDKHDIYLIEMRSLGNVLIRGWYQVPVKPGRYPAIMQVPGYGGNEIPSYINYGDDIIGFGLNIRGHGNSKDDVGFTNYLINNIEDKEKYVYRGAYMDCVRGVDFLCSRPEVDASRIAVEGASQGGALTFATAALNNDRIAVCAPQVPFLSDFRDYFKVATWPGNEFKNYIETEKKVTWDEVYYTLSYFDIKNLAPMIRAPLIMGVGLMDDVCPPHINFAAYNNVTSEKKYLVYPQAGHGLPQAFYFAKMDWIKNKFGMK